MICNECATKQCKHKVYQDKQSGRFECPDYTLTSGSWKFLEVALGNNPQAVHDLMQRFNLKVKER